MIAEIPTTRVTLQNVEFGSISGTTREAKISFGKRMTKNEAASRSVIDEKKISEWLDSVYTLNEFGEVRTAIDVVFDYFNKQIRDGRYDICNQVIANIDVGLISPTLMVAFLSITLPIKNEPELWARKPFYRQIYSRLVESRGEERTSRLLNKYL